MPRKHLTNARRLRNHSTDAEKLFWSRVRDRQLFGHKFRRQVVIENYIVDFACIEGRLVVELDGGQHDRNVDDQARDARLQKLGVRVLRYWNHEVLSNVEGVLEAVTAALIDKDAASPAADACDLSPIR